MLRPRRLSLVCTAVAAVAVLSGCNPQAHDDTGRAPTAPPSAVPAAASSAVPAVTPPLASESGPAAAAQLSLLVEPDRGIAPFYALIASARTSLDLTMYEFDDPDAALALEEAASRGVRVRVVLDTNDERAANQPAFDELTAMGVHVVWADPRYAATHEKSLVVDDKIAAIMTLNLTARYYSDTRDFAVLDTNLADVAAIEQVFNADLAHAVVTPSRAADLVWSPGQSAPALLSVIDSARSTLLVENEEMSYSPVVSALSNAARRGVRVTVVMTDQPQWHSAFAKLVAARVDVRVYAATAALYIHAKAIVADAGTTHQRAFVGSENFSAASLDHNRELGVLTPDPALVRTLAATITDDADAAASWHR